MAIRRITILEDDLDGSRADETVIFAVDGISYEIDLNTAHANELRAALRPYTDAARKTSFRGKARPSLENKGPSSAKVRAWAKEQGLTVNSRGRIQREILNKYEAAH
jgi:hypothetical protein